VTPCVLFPLFSSLSWSESFAGRCEATMESANTARFGFE
jgi:hypothetical protein